MATKATEPSGGGGFSTRSSPRSSASATRSRIPAIIFFWLIGLVVLLSVILSFVGWSATYEAIDPVTHEVVTQTTTVRSLLSRDGIRLPR